MLKVAIAILNCDKKPNFNINKLLKASTRAIKAPFQFS